MTRPGPAADALRGTFPGCEDAPLASALVRLLAQGKPVTDASLAEAAGRGEEDVAAQLVRWPNIERDAEGAVTDAARQWRSTHPDGDVLDLAAAFELGCGATAPLVASSAGRECC